MSSFFITPPSEQEVQDFENQKKVGPSTSYDPTDSKPQTVETEADQPQPLQTTVSRRPSSESGLFVEDGKIVSSDEVQYQRGLFTDEPTYVESVLGQFAAGFNDIILALPDMAINAIGSGLKLGYEKGSPEIRNVLNKFGYEGGQIDKNILSRIFSSPDYEAQEVLIPYLLTYGKGQFVGAGDDAGFVKRAARTAGQATGVAAPMIGVQSQLAGTSAAAGNVVGQQMLQEGGKRSTFLGVPTEFGATNIVREGMLAPYKTAPAAAAALDLSLNAIGGVGTQAEADVFGTQTGVGGLVAPVGLAGLIYGTKAILMGPFARLYKAGKATVDEMKVQSGEVSATTGAEGEKAATAIGQEYQAAAGTESGAAAIAKAAEIESRVGDLKLTPAERTMDKPLLVTQKRAEQTGAPDFTRQNLARKEEAVKTVTNFVDDELTGDALIDGPLLIYSDADNRVATTLQRAGRLEEKNAESISKLQAITEGEGGALPALPEKAGIGDDMRGAVVIAYETAKDNAYKYAEKLNINSFDQWSSADAVQKAQQKVRDILGTRAGDDALSELPKPVQKFLDFTGKDGKYKLTFQDWKNFKSSIGEEIGVAYAKGRNEQARNLTIFSEILDDIGTSPAFGKTNEKLKLFSDYYRENVVVPFEKSAVIKISAKGPGSSKEAPVYLLADEKVAGTFLKDSNTAKQFMTLFKDSESKMRHIRAVVLDEVRSKAFPNGEITSKSADKVNTYINQNRDVLSTLGLTNELTDTSSLIQAMNGRAQQLTKRRRVLEQNLLFQALAKSQKVNDPEVLLTEALNPRAKGGSELIRQLWNSVKKGTNNLSSEQAQQAFRATVMEKLMQDAPDAATDPTAFKRFLDQRYAGGTTPEAGGTGGALNIGGDKTAGRSILRTVFTDQHIRDMYLIADAFERITAAGPLTEGGAGAGSANMLDRFRESTGLSAAATSNVLRARGEGRMSKQAATGFFLTRVFNAQSTARNDALFREMMFNPELAKALTVQNDTIGAIAPSTYKKINNYLFSIGLGLGEDYQLPSDNEVEVQIKPSIKFPEVDVPTMLPPTASEDDFAASFAADPFFNQNATNSTTSAPIQMASAASPKTSVTQLFPFDSTGAAIESRQNQKQQNAGIMSLPR